MKTFESPLRDILRLVVWYPIRWLILLVPIRAGIGVLRFMGDVHYWCAKGGRCALARSMAGTVDDARLDWAVREYFRNHYIDQLMILIFPRLGEAEVGKLVEFEGLDKLKSALESGKGVVLVHGHFGPAHLPLVALARMGYRLKQIGYPSDEGLSWVGRNVAFRLRMAYEERMPAEIINAAGFMRDAFKWLAGGGVIMVTGDGSGREQEMGKQEMVRFLGRDRAFPKGPGILAEKTGAALLPMFVRPGVEKLYKVVIEEPLAVEGVDAGEVAEGFAERYECEVRANPGLMHFWDRMTDETKVVE